MYDVFFLSYNEPSADENFGRLLQIAPHAKRVHGITGIHQAHITCASMAETSHFFTVDADNWVLDDFRFELDFDPDQDAVYVWRCRNPVNDLVYGYGAIKLFPTHRTKQMSVGTVDMTTSVSTNYKIVNVLASETRFNTDPFEAWKSGFREAVKLSSGIIRNQDKATSERLQVWCSEGLDRPWGMWTIYGAKLGRAYGTVHANNPQELARINDFNWLKERYEEAALALAKNGMDAIYAND